MTLFKRNLLILITILLFFSSVPAFADDIKPYEFPNNKVIEFSDAEGISLVYQGITATPLEGDIQPIMHYKVQYTLKETSGLDQALSVDFMLPFMDPDSFNISMTYEDGTSMVPKRFDNLESTQDILYLEHPRTKFFVEPTTGKLFYKDMSFCSNYTSSYRLDIKANSIAELTVNYTGYGGVYSTDELINPIYGYIFYLTPASTWNDDTSSLRLVVDSSGLPNYKVYSTIPMNEIDPHVYEARFNKRLNEEWQIYLTDKRKLTFGTNLRKWHNSLSALVILLSVIAAIYTKKKYPTKKKSLTLIFSLLMLLYMYMLISGYLIRPSYGWSLVIGMLILHPISIAVMTVLVATVIIIKYRRAN